MKHNRLAAFHWRDDPRPSIFIQRAFVPNINGESASQTASRAVRAYEAKTGRSQGTVMGISSAADRATEQFRQRAADRRIAK